VFAVSCAHHEAGGEPGIQWSVIRAASALLMLMTVLCSLLERQQHIQHLLAVARLLHVGDLTAAAIGDAGFRDLG
jgi:hypothetical protein